MSKSKRKNTVLSINEIIRQINRSCGDHDFCLSSQSGSGLIYTISGKYLTDAINSNSEEPIKVSKWFDDFWLYITIQFSLSDVNNETPYKFSLSVFQGVDDDKQKNQLFRAEWDNFEDNNSHPQPHWHFYTAYNSDKSYNNFAEYLEGTDTDSTFLNSINNTKSNIDIQKIHFAMNAAWDKRGGHIHKINDADSFISWLQGLLEHIKIQLKYIQK
jgi:hypothetical protein